jgi:hypothetical protein
MKPTNEVNSQTSSGAPEATEHATPQTPKKKTGKGNIFQKILSGDFLVRDGLIKHLSFVLFLVGLFIANIALVYYFENTAREKVKLQNQLNELRSQYNTTMSDLEKSKQQSNVAQAIEQMGLQELRTPPQVIDVEQGFFEDKTAQE